MPDEQAFADFVRDRAPALCRYGYVLTGNGHDADDLVQDALIRLRGAWPRLDAAADPMGYARTVMARLHISAWRRRRRERLTDAVPDTGVLDPGVDDADRQLWAALATLPPRQRAVLVLRYYEHLTDTEIADTLGIARGTIRSQAARALDKLRAMPAVALMREPT